MAERQIGHRKSRLVLSTRFLIANRCSRSVAKSAYMSRKDPNMRANLSTMRVYAKKGDPFAQASSAHASLTYTL